MADFVTVKDVTFGYGRRVILDDVTLRFGQGQVVAIMGGSGMGKTTLLKLIGGLETPDRGSILIDGEPLDTSDKDKLYAQRRRMGMLFQFGALFTDMSVLDNVAFPLREQTDLSEELIVRMALMKLNAVGLRGAADLMPSEISGGMSRRVALARAIALDPELIMYDEPFAGLDPISMGVTARLIRDLNDALNATSIIVTHDVPETFAIALGAWTLEQIRHVGRLALFSIQLFKELPAALGRFWLIVQQIHFIGNYSLLIIAVSGLFVGFVLALQGYYILVSYGSEQALGVMVALSLARELGPVVAALLFAGRAGTSLTAEIGLMRAGEQVAAMEMMGVDPVRRVLAPRFWGVLISLPLLACIFTAVGIFGAWIVGVVMIGVDGGAFWSQMQAGVDVFSDVGNSVIKSVVFAVAVGLISLYQGYNARPTPEGVSRATTRTVVISSLMVLGLDFIMTALMFSV